MSGGRGCFNCGGCALSLSLSLPSCPTPTPISLFSVFFWARRIPIGDVADDVSWLFFPS
ncbi:hypothetical protein K438DRAFT_1804839, partial [Mycena galopus ATCC 62051]